MALIVEDGTGVDGANTYASLVDVLTYASARGVTLVEDDAVLEPLVHKAMDYIEGKGLGLLSISWPVDNDLLCGDIPTADALVRLSQAVSQVCMQQSAGVDIAPTQEGAFILEETVGPITTKYSDKFGSGAGSTPDMIVADNLLAPLLTACGLGGLFSTIRV